jgi:hypothetical protein
MPHFDTHDLSKKGSFDLVTLMNMQGTKYTLRNGAVQENQFRGGVEMNHACVPIMPNHFTRDLPC